MAVFYQVVALVLFLVLCGETFSLPFPEADSQDGLVTRKSFRGFLPKTKSLRWRRAEGESGGSGGSGIGETISTAIKDAIAASSAFDSPTMFVGGFSVMMQPMPNGTEFAGQLMQMAPNYMNLLPGAGRR